MLTRPHIRVHVGYGEQEHKTFTRKEIMDQEADGPGLYKSDSGNMMLCLDNAGGNTIFLHIKGDRLYLAKYPVLTKLIRCWSKVHGSWTLTLNFDKDADR